ncbi:MAG: ATP-binding protein [Polyangiaceae bacterium]|nr:ATP-binding protein [Polyangiaceae bacterium]
MKKLKKEVGNWVAGEERFWDRETEIPHLIELLENGAHVLLVAPRRVGKTSLMREVARRIEGRFTCLFIDLQKAQTPADAMAELAFATRPHQGLFARTREAFKNTLSNVESLGNDELMIKLRDGFSSSWQARAKRLLDDLALAEKPVVIFMDELPILVNRLLRNADGRRTPENICEADMFMSFLRSQSAEHQGKLRFVVAGSIGLQPILRAAGLSATVNNFTPFALEPWDNYTAIGCIEALANDSKVKLAEGVPQKMVALLGSCVPHHVQMFFMHLYADARRNGMEPNITVDDVERVFQKSMLSSRGHSELSHFEERLSAVLSPDDLPLAFDLLTEAAVSGKLTDAAIAILVQDDTEPPPRPMGFVPSAPTAAMTREQRERVRDLLDIFEHDGYLERDDDGYVFVSRLVCEWWKARHKLGYVPVSERRRSR